MSDRPFRILGVQQIAVGALDKGELTNVLRVSSQTESSKSAVLICAAPAQLGGRCTRQVALVSLVAHALLSK